MKKILIAVDDTKGSKAVLLVFHYFAITAVEVILLHVERLEGKSLMIDMLGEAELSTLKESIEGTEHKEALDNKAENILNYYKKELRNNNILNVKTVIKEGNPAEEILRVAGEEGVELIIMGYSGKKWLNRLITGCAAKEVERNTKIPILIAKKPFVYQEVYSLKSAYTAILTTMAVVFGLFFLSIFILKVILERW